MRPSRRTGRTRPGIAIEPATALRRSPDVEHEFLVGEEVRRDDQQRDRQVFERLRHVGRPEQAQHPFRIDQDRVGQPADQDVGEAPDARFEQSGQNVSAGRRSVRNTCSLRSLPEQARPRRRPR